MKENEERRTKKNEEQRTGEKRKNRRKKTKEEKDRGTMQNQEEAGGEGKCPHVALSRALLVIPCVWARSGGPPPDGFNYQNGMADRILSWGNDPGDA